MKKNINKFIVFLCTLGITISGFEANVNADAGSKNSADKTITRDRIYGSDRIGTSLKISQNGWKDGSSTVVIAQGYGYADALCAAPLAKNSMHL
ncbi:cell wall-binding repeat-containing protein [Clostridium ljungdahlii]|uniref:cell wall-binding repeat-containing protein n=1 Tax=Clostridium ljungdahlii TaxID=1538 RepID=UPI0038703DAF